MRQRLGRFAKEPLFWIGLGIRIALLPFFGSAYLRELFIPFIDHAITAPLANPWTAFPSNYFPYGSALFLLEFIPKKLAYLAFGQTALGQTPLSIALMKLPLVGLDILLFTVLAEFAPRNLKRIQWFYWLNPIVLYISYVHAQLDLASVAFAILALYGMTRDRIALSGFAYALAALCKFQVIAVFPFIAAFIWNTSFRPQALRRLSLFSSIAVVVSAVGFLPQLTAHALEYVTVSSPQAMRLFATRVNIGPHEALYVGICALLLLIGRLMISDRITEKGLILGSGLVFGSLLLVTNPMPGWYLWALPFLALFYATYSQAPWPLHLGFQLSYLAFFVLAPRLFPADEFVRGLTLSILQTSLAAQLLLMYRCIARSEIPFKEKINRLKIGIAGDSGAGKDHLSSVLQGVFGERESLVLKGDDYHRWERHHERWSEFTHLSPQANKLNALSAHAHSLTHGQTIRAAAYDHRYGTFEDERDLAPSRTLFVQGLHALYPRSLRAHYDLKIFLYPDEQVRMFWKLSRDVGERGHSKQAVLDSIAKRAQDSRRYVMPQADFADWIIQYRMLSDNPEQGREIELEQVHYVWNDVWVEDLVEELAHLDPTRAQVKLEADESHFDRNRFACRLRPSAESIGAIARRLFPNLRQLTRAKEEPIWKEGFDGISQLVALTILASRQHHGAAH